ncbi:MAG TPA: septal ring lytic transglycosylase RlpA family protein [Actinomycetota bacterium]|nr:septal ring lytic transglycosylase RlpA family protein [Actinomycetota bacterium]
MKGPRALPRAVSVVLAAVVGASLIQPAATATDLEVLRRQAQQLADEVTSLERQRAQLVEKEEVLGARIESVTAEIGILGSEIHDANRGVAEARARFIDRAVEVYKGGSITRLALLLSADTLGELMTMAEATMQAGHVEGEALEDLEAARAIAEAAQLELDERKQTLLAAHAEAQTLSIQIDDTIGERRARLAEMTGRLTELEAQARQAARVAAAAQNIDVGSELLKILEPAGPSRGIPDGFASTGVTFEGIASWYGPGFEGNPTASGQIFDPSLYTAASKELPLGSWLHVAHEGRGVVVLVNDRGPYVGERILDLSHAAAQAIGITGLGWVKATILVKSGPR